MTDRDQTATSDNAKATVATALSADPGGGEPPLPPVGAPDPILVMIANAARDPQVDIEKFERLMTLRERVAQSDARRSFYAALANAKGEFGPILKKRMVDYPHKEGSGSTKYAYEEFADISAVVDPVLSKWGLTYRFKTVQDGAKVKVTCILSHADGYSEENSLEGVEDKSGQKNANQAIGSTVTYLQRYTLKEAVGVGASRDDDGQGGDDPIIALDDVIYLETLIRDTDSDLPKFLENIGAPALAEMTLSQFKRAATLLNEKKRRLSKAAKAGAR
jgi:hypothetical protein